MAETTRVRIDDETIRVSYDKKKQPILDRIASFESDRDKKIANITAKYQPKIDRLNEELKEFEQ